MDASALVCVCFYFVGVGCSVCALSALGLGVCVCVCVLTPFGLNAGVVKHGITYRETFNALHTYTREHLAKMARRRRRRRRRVLDPMTEIMHEYMR